MTTAAARAHWEKYPCGINLELGEPGTREFFENLRHFKYFIDYPEILEFVRFDEWHGKDVLEVGCGLGSDTQTWLEAGARLRSIDFTQKAVDMTAERLRLFGHDFRPLRADALFLPFSDNAFDCYYSWGVLMHTGNTRRGIEEARRVLRPGGIFIAMFYNKNSLLYRFYVRVLGRRFDDDAPITEFYSQAEIRDLMDDLLITEMRRYYLLPPNVSRLGQYIPKRIERWLGRYFGACVYVRAVKPEA